MFRRALPYISLSLSPFLFSCGESSLFGSKTNACSLVTVAEVERALGEPVQEGIQTNSTTCTFKAQRHESHTVTVQLDDASSKDQRTWFNKERLRRDSRLIPGLGDGAVRVDAPTLSRLTFMHKDNFVTLSIASTKQRDLPQAVTTLARTAATHYGAPVVATLSSTTSSPTPDSTPEHSAANETSSRPSAVSLTHTLPGPAPTQDGPKKASMPDLTNLVGTWQTHVTQGTTQHDMLLIIRPNHQWSLSSMMQFDGVMNAESGQWSLERANTFKGLGWKGTYRKTTQHSFASTGSVQATWKRLSVDQHPTHIPLELWKLRREASSVPVFQLKTVDPDLVGQWEGAGTYAGGSAAFVWAIQPSAATDLVIVGTFRGTIQLKDGVPHLQPNQKRLQRVSIVAFHDHGFTTTDGKATLRWNKLQPEQTEAHQL